MVKHKMMLPPRARGTVTWIASAGHYRVTDKILEIEFDGEKTPYTMLQVRIICEMSMLALSFYVYFT